MTASPDTTGTLPPVPPPSAVDSSPAPEVAPAGTPEIRKMRTRISGMRVGLIVSAVALVVLLIFIIQNPHTVNISFLGAHLHLPQGVALLLAAIVGVLLMAGAGTARIAQLRGIMRHDRRARRAS